MGEGLILPDEIRNTPIRCLGPSTRRLLSCYLDPPAISLTADGLLPDITGLADIAGFDTVFIRYLETKPNKTVTFLDAWGTRNNATIGNLVDFLNKLERFDVIHDVREFFVNDVAKWIQRSKPEEKKEFATFPTESRFDLNNSNDDIDTEDILLTVDDVESGSLQKYTACICCSENDLDLANVIVDRYTHEQSNFRFFIPQEHLLGGRYEFEATAEVIESRCDGRLIVILSKSYLTSPACSFATQFAKTLDPDSKRRKIIPIVRDENIVFPRVLRGITTIKAQRLQNSGVFWRLLTSSLSLVPRCSSLPNENPVPYPSLTSYPSSSSLPVGREDQLSFITSSDVYSKNITDEEDISNLSRDSMSLRSGSFDSAPDLGECEKIVNNNDTCNFICNIQNQTNEYDLKTQTETMATTPIQRVRSVPNVLELTENETDSISQSDIENGRFRSSSCSLTQKTDNDKKESGVKSSKSPRQWLVKKLLKSFNTGSKTNKNKIDKKQVNVKEKQSGTALTKRVESVPCVIEAYKASEVRNVDIGPGRAHQEIVTDVLLMRNEARNERKVNVSFLRNVPPVERSPNATVMRKDVCEERVNTVTLVRNEPYIEGSGPSSLSSNEKNPRKPPDKSQTEEVSRRQYFTLDL